MGFIKKPYGIDFIVDPKPLGNKDREMISEVIAHYKATGRKKSFIRIKKRNRKTNAQKVQ